MSSIFGGSKKKSSQQGSGYSSSQGSSQSRSSSESLSHNLAYPYLKDAYSGQVSTGTGANAMLANLLGLGNDPAAAADAFQRYRNSAGFNSTLAAGSDAISGNAASRGLLSSGATLKRLAGYGQELNQQYYGNYLNQLLGLSNQGLQAGGLISGAGNESTSKSQSEASSQQSSQSRNQYSGSSSGKSKPGLGGFVGSALSNIPLG